MSFSHSVTHHSPLDTKHVSLLVTVGCSKWLRSKFSWQYFICSSVHRSQNRITQFGRHFWRSSDTFWTKTDIKKESCNCSNLPRAWFLLVNGEEHVWLVAYVLHSRESVPRLSTWSLKVSLLGLKQPYLLPFYRDYVFWFPPSQAIHLCHQGCGERALQL